ncbi:MAG: AmmeMemoRadiSam system protein A [Candidatus Gottesmanbacteria bacterium]
MYQTMDDYIALAKNTIEEYIKNGKVIPVPKNIPQEMINTQAGTFVSIHTKDGQLRGCIGTFIPCQKCIAQEIIHNALSAATHDPRFLPITKDELPDLTYSVDILSKPVLFPKPYTLNPKKDGLIVSTGDGRRGLLLPDLEGVDTIEQQINICKQKGGIYEDEPVTYQTFTVERHEE